MNLRRVLRLLILKSLVLNPIFAGEGIPVEISLLSGDGFAGYFRSFERGYFNVVPSWGGEGLRFHAAYTESLRFLASSRSDRPPAPNRVRFVNGDQLSVDLIHLTDEEVTLETLWGQRLVANRAFVESIEMLPSGDDLIFRGLGSLSEWEPVSGIRGRELERMQKEWFLAENGRISRRLPMPGQGSVLLELEVSFPAGMTSATFEVFQTKQQNRLAEGMVLTLNPSWMHVRALDANGRQVWVMREPFLPENAEGRVSISIYLNLETSEVTLRLNEVDYPSFYLHTERPLPGREDMEVALQAGRESGGMQFHHVGFTRFRGEVNPEVDPGTSHQDRVVFMNGDQMVAKVGRLDQEGVLLRLQEGQEVRVPRSRIRAVYLGTKPSVHPRRRDRDVQVDLMERGDRLTLALAGLHANGLEGVSDLWKTDPEIPFVELGGVRFNIYHPPRTADGMTRAPLFLFER